MIPRSPFSIANLFRDSTYFSHCADHFLLQPRMSRDFYVTGDYWVVGVDIEQYDETRPDKYLRGLWQQETDLSILNAYRSYFSIVASAPINLMNFTRLVNEHRQKPPFNFTNPLANIGGLVQVTIMRKLYEQLSRSAAKPDFYSFETLLGNFSLLKIL